MALRLRLGLVQPVDLRIGEVPPVTERDMQPDAAVLSPGLEQQHLVAAVGGEAIGEHAAGRARADNDEIEIRHAAFATGLALASARIMSDAFSPIITQAALVLPDTTVGMIEASATRRPPKPCTRSRSSTTAVTSEPMRQVEVGWNTVVPLARANSSRSASLCTWAPGISSSSI